MLNGISPSFGNIQKEDSAVYYITTRTGKQGLPHKRILQLQPSERLLTETDEKGKPKSGLSRVMTEEEAILSREVPSPKRQTYIDLIDSGLSVKDAGYISRSNPKYGQYQTLTTVDEDGKPKTGASRVLTQQEAVFFVKDGAHSLTPSKIQDFIDLVDEGLSFQDCKNILMRKAVLDRYHSLTRADEDGKPKSGASRVLSKKEALTVLYGNLEPKKVQNFIDAVDVGAPPEIAVTLAQSAAMTKSFVSYIKTDETGVPLSGLSRTMTVEEAYYAVFHKGNKERLLFEIDNGIRIIPAISRFDRTI